MIVLRCDAFNLRMHTFQIRSRINSFATAKMKI